MDFKRFLRSDLPTGENHLHFSKRNPTETPKEIPQKIPHQNNNNNHLACVADEVTHTEPEVARRTRLSQLAVQSQPEPNVVGIRDFTFRYHVTYRCESVPGLSQRPWVSCACALFHLKIGIHLNSMF